MFSFLPPLILLMCIYTCNDLESSKLITFTISIYSSGCTSCFITVVNNLNIPDQISRLFHVICQPSRKTLKISVEMALVMCEKITGSCGLKKSAACQHFPPANSAGGHFWDDEKVTPSKVTLPPIIMEVKMGPQ